MPPRTESTDRKDPSANQGSPPGEGGGADPSTHGAWKLTDLKSVSASIEELCARPVLLIPLPPLAEQAAIVERVGALMETCRALEAEVEHTRTHAAHLLQAVLKEAFAPASTNG